MKNNNELGERAKICLNPKCGAVLFVSGKMDPYTEDRGVDRDIQKNMMRKGILLSVPNVEQSIK